MAREDQRRLRRARRGRRSGLRHRFRHERGREQAVEAHADARTQGKERVLCLEAKTGKEVWKHEYDCTYEVSYPAGPRCTPTVHDGKVYALGTEGNLYCLDAKKGAVLWSKDFKKDYGAKTPIWGHCGHPLVDGKKLICTVGGKGSVVVAFDKDSGKELWKALDATELGYSPPTMITAGGRSNC